MDPTNDYSEGCVWYNPLRSRYHTSMDSPYMFFWCLGGFQISAVCPVFFAMIFPFLSILKELAWK